MKRIFATLLAVMMLFATLLTSCTAAPATVEPTATPITTVKPTPEAVVVPTKLESDVFGNGAVGTKMAVVSANEYTSAIGMEILQAGGNAVDAAVAMMFANSLTEPGASTIAGAALFTIYLKETNEYICIEGLETVPAACGLDTLEQINAGGPEMLVTVPGQVHAALTALEKYGTMSAEDVLAPVIKLAEEGFPVFTSFYERATSSYNTFVSGEQFAEAARIYTNDGLPYAMGDTFKNPDFATLRKIAAGGIDAFYKGEIAQTIVDFVQSYGGLITMEDFANYTSVERVPISTTYHGYTVITQPAPSNGGGPMLEMMNILEEYDLVSMGYGTAEFWFTFNEALRLAQADGRTFFGDPDFYNVPLEEMTSKEYADARRALMPAYGTANPTPVAGDLVTTKIENPVQDSPDTTHVSVLDQYGNMVSTTHTIGNYFGGCTVAPGTGFALNSHLLNVVRDAERVDHPNFVQGGKRIMSTMCPSLVIKDGEPILALGSPGSSAIPPLNALMIIALLQFGLDAQEAVNLPRVICTSSGTSSLLVEDRVEYGIVAKLESCGYTINATRSYSSGAGSAAIILKDSETGWVIAAGDDRRQYRSLAE